MKKIKNNYIKRLSFILGDEGSFVIESNEEKNVDDDLADKLLKNPWIQEVKPVQVKQEIQKNEQVKKIEENIKKVEE